MAETGEERFEAKLFSSTKPPTRADAEALAEGLVLAGRPLEPPNFHRVKWRTGQKFTPKDDPDRTAEPWQPPSFIQSDPTSRHATMSVEELQLPRKPSSESFARIVRGALSEEECAAIIRAVNVKGFTPALLNVGGGNQLLAPESRDGFRVIVDSAPLSAWLLEVLRPYLPAHVDRQQLQLESLNERCRFLCYTPGQEFPQHYDACFTHPSTQASSFVTVQLYLHDVPSESGGSTTFLFGRRAGESDVKCQPGAGSVLVFSQDLLHEGSLLKHGLKYTFRTEAMYK